MAITPVASFSRPQPIAVMGIPVRRGPDPELVLSPVADKLGMSYESLRTQLEQGTSLASIATSKGLSRNDLVEAVKQGLTKAEAAQPEQTSANAATRKQPPIDKVAAAIADGEIPPLPPVAGPRSPDGTGNGPDAGDGRRHRHGTARNREAGRAALATVASLLDMSPTELIASLTSGTSLDHLAETRSVDVRNLLRAVSPGMVYDNSL